jgi:hypothetical protein
MSVEQKTTAMAWAKFIVASILAGAMLYLHSYVKDLPMILLAGPYVLMGVDLSKFITIGKK